MRKGLNLVTLSWIPLLVCVLKHRTMLLHVIKKQQDCLYFQFFRNEYITYSILFLLKTVIHFPRLFATYSYYESTGTGAKSHYGFFNIENITISRCKENSDVPNRKM
jgi:hypothetical protein